MLLLFRVADWFAQLNNKMGGDLNKIQTVGKVCLVLSNCYSLLKHLRLPNMSHHMSYHAVHD